MADDECAEVICRSNPTLMAEIVELIVRNLPWRDLRAAAQFCWLWRDTVRTLRLSRCYCTTYQSPPNLQFVEFYSSFLEFIDQQKIEPKIAVMFTSKLPSSSSLSYLEVLTDKVKEHLPKRCSLVGCTGFSVVGTNSDPERFPLAGTLQPRQEDIWECVSLMLLPSCKNLEVDGFRMPAAEQIHEPEKYKVFPARLLSLSVPGRGSCLSTVTREAAGIYCCRQGEYGPEVSFHIEHCVLPFSRFFFFCGNRVGKFILQFFTSKPQNDTIQLTQQ